MKTEPATLLVVEIGSIAFFFLFLPLVVVLSKLREIWQANRETGLVLIVIVGLTGFFFTLFFVGLAAVVFSG